MGGLVSSTQNDVFQWFGKIPTPPTNQTMGEISDDNERVLHWCLGGPRRSSALRNKSNELFGAIFSLPYFGVLLIIKDIIRYFYFHKTKRDYAFYYNLKC